MTEKEFVSGSQKKLEEVTVTAGIDISENWVDIYVHPLGHSRRFLNDVQSLEEASLWLKTYKVDKIVCENTGGLERLLQKTFRKNGLECYTVNPYRISAFRTAYARNAKTDLLDAELIAIFALKMDLYEPILLTEVEEELKELNTRRRQIVEMQVQERNRLRRTVNEQSIKSIKGILELLQRQRSELEKEMMKLMKKDERLKEKFEILTSVSGIGDVVGLTILCELPELGVLEDKQISSLAGVAPHSNDSGLKRGKASIRGGRKCLRTAIYMAALSAKTHNPFIKTFYDGLVTRGKPKKVALIASMRKILILCNRLIQDNRKFEPLSKITS